MNAKDSATLLVAAPARPTFAPGDGRAPGASQIDLTGDLRGQKHDGDSQWVNLMGESPYDDEREKDRRGDRADEWDEILVGLLHGPPNAAGAFDL